MRSIRVAYEFVLLALEEQLLDVLLSLSYDLEIFGFEILLLHVLVLLLVDIDFSLNHNALVVSRGEVIIGFLEHLPPEVLVRVSP